MSGVTKHIFNQEVRDILSMWDCEIKTIEPLLPKEYSSGDIITLLKEFYPHEWHSVEIKYVYYQTKDRYIKRKFGKSRYHMKAPEVLLMDASRCKKILSKEYQRIHFDNYTEESGVLARENLWLKRKPKIERVNQKIEKALSKVQQVTPSFIDQLIGLYERKNTSQKDRRYILLELKKYYSDKIIQFFFKLNDTELNKQLRWEAFYHLQSFNYQPRARRQKYMQVHTKNKKRKEFLKEVYPFETYEIPQNPNELEYRIENSREQKIKEYVNSSDWTGLHYMVRTVTGGYYKASGTFTLPSVNLKSSLSDPDVPYGFFGIYVSDKIGLDLGTYYSQKDGEWGFDISGYIKNSAGEYAHYWRPSSIKYSPSQLSSVNLVATITKGSAYDTVTLKIINGVSWAVIDTITLNTNETGHNATFTKPVNGASESYVTSNYTNLYFNREVCLAYDKQSNRAPTGTTILNARWSQVYLYTPSNGYGLWGTAATTFAHKTAQTSTLANKVSVSITTKWSEDTTNILYQ